MRLNIEHVTGFRYEHPVEASYNEARMTPLSGATQTVWSSRLTISPAAWTYHFTDYWGTLVTGFELQEPHQEMTVIAHGVVETSPNGDAWDERREVPDSDLSWSALRSSQVRDTMAELLGTRVLTSPPAALVEAGAAIAADRPPRLAVLDICTMISEQVTYRPGNTSVTSTAAEAWAGRRGVCQDFSHIAIGALRSVGIPSRYVSGYLHPRGVSARPHESVTGQSHSWLEFWCGEWVAFDPSSCRRVGEHHVRIGHGRDYRDVPPVRGTYAGGGESELEVVVSLTPLG